MVETEWIVFLAVSFVKALLVPTYRSTDFEVHRNWLAITHSLPLDEWYIDESSIWTLDYPPFFAWFERLLAYFAVYFDADMLDVSNTNYASFETVLFQRLTVMLSDLVLFYAIRRYSYTWPIDREFGTFLFESWSKRKMVAILIVTLFNAGLLMVDHIHFQYNGLLIGLYLLSIVSIREGQARGAAFYFAILLCMKHIFIYVAPLYAVYLLAAYVFVEEDMSSRQPFWTWHEFSITHKQKHYAFRWTHLFSLAFVVLTPALIAFAPFLFAFGQTLNLWRRLFPFGRGLTHAYWAPNLWALYNAADIVLTQLLSKTKNQSQVTRGLVGEYTTSTLPAIQPLHCFLLTLLSMAPVLYAVWRRPNAKTFLPAALYVMMCSFMCGYHVHEKAILMVSIPLCLVSLDSTAHAHLSLFLNLTANASLLPLLPNMQETPIKLALLCMHCILLYVVLNTELKVYQSLHHFKQSGLNLNLNLNLNPTSLYLFGFVALQVFYSVLQPLLLPRYQFAPLMLFSVYSAAGCLYAWFKCYRLFFETMNIVYS